jgi:hypothetical protein
VEPHSKYINNKNEKSTGILAGTIISGAMALGGVPLKRNHYQLQMKTLLNR